MFFYFIIITLCFSYTKGQYFFEEKCPNMDAMHDFNLEKVLLNELNYKYVSYF